MIILAAVLLDFVYFMINLTAVCCCDTRNTVFCIASAAVTVATAGKTEFA